MMNEDYALRIPDVANVHQELGIRNDLITPDKVVLSVEVGPKVHQPFGLLHGGVSALLAEGAASIGGVISVPEGFVAVGTELNISHLRAVSSGRVFATATPIRKGQTVHVWAITITDERERQIAVGRCTLQVIKARPAV
jgi:uncharacterized protein (TIGR00369 family)